MDDIAYNRPSGLWLAHIQVWDAHLTGNYDKGEFGQKHLGFFTRNWWFGVDEPQMPFGATLCGRELWLERRNRRIYDVSATRLRITDNLRLNCRFCAMHEGDKDAAKKAFTRAASDRAKKGLLWGDLPAEHADKLRAMGLREWPAER